MPKAHEIAIELRKLADALDVQPDMNMVRPWVWFHSDTKDQFVNSVTIMPRPFAKSETESRNASYNRIQIRHMNAAVDILACVYKSLTCELVEPAKPAVYRCDPILSALEEASLEVVE